MAVFKLFMLRDTILFLEGDLVSHVEQNNVHGHSEFNTKQNSFVHSL